MGAECAGVARHQPTSDRVVTALRALFIGAGTRQQTIRKEFPMETHAPVMPLSVSTPSELEAKEESLKNQRRKAMDNYIAALDDCGLYLREREIAYALEDVFRIIALALGNEEYDKERPPIMLFEHCENMASDLADMCQESYHRLYYVKEEKRIAVNG